MAPKKMEEKKTVKRAPKNTAVVKAEPRTPQVFDASVVSDLVLHGDLRQFSPEQKAKYYTQLCQSLRLNPLTRPFQLIVLNNKETLYATRDAAEQLRKINGVSVVDMNKTKDGDLYIVTVKVQDNTGRYDMASGAVSLKGLTGDALANKLMTAETKAKRRATLSICGLGMLDETEVATIPGTQYTEPGMAPPPADERLEKIKALPENIKEGLRILQYNVTRAHAMCEAEGWDNEKILKHINKMIDGQVKP